MLSLPRLAFLLVLLVILFAVVTQRMFLNKTPSTYTEDNRQKIQGSSIHDRNFSIKSLVQLIGNLPNLGQGQGRFSNISHSEESHVVRKGTTKNNVMKHNSSALLPHKPYPVTPSTYDTKDVHNNLAILKCPNQSTCNVPGLQLKRKFKIYFCKHPVSYGVRFYFIAKEAFILHPNVIHVSESHIQEADFIIYLPGSAPWHKTECANSSYARKLIVLDEFDPHHKFSPYPTLEDMIKHYPRYKQTGSWYFMYFKRSFVTRHNGTFMRYPHLDQTDVYPMVYSIAEAYIRPKFNFIRELEYVCTLRGSAHMQTRLRVQSWVAEYSTMHKLINVISGEVIPIPLIFLLFIYTNYFSFFFSFITYIYFLVGEYSFTIDSK